MGKLITQEEVPEPFVEHIIPAIQEIDEVVESILVAADGPRWVG